MSDLPNQTVQPPRFDPSRVTWESYQDALKQVDLAQWERLRHYHGDRVIDVSLAIVWKPGTKLHVTSDAYVRAHDWTVVIGKTRCRRTLRTGDWLASFASVPEGYTPLTKVPEADFCQDCADSLLRLDTQMLGLAKTLAEHPGNVGIRPQQWPAQPQYASADENLELASEDDTPDDLDLPPLEEESAPSQVKVLRRAEPQG